MLMDKPSFGRSCINIMKYQTNLSTHLHFEQLKSALQTNFTHLKEATYQNTQNLQTALRLQQSCTSTLSSHITNICSKIAELQNQIQQHCMYPHNSQQLHADTVQLDALDYDPDIDSDRNISNSSRNVTVSVNNILEDDQSIPELIDDNTTEHLTKILQKPIGLKHPPSRYHGYHLLLWIHHLK